jgi:hypothetical protein
MPYDDRYVAYMDILGFRSLVERIPSEPALYNEAVAAFNVLETELDVPLELAKTNYGFRKQIISDGIVMSSDNTGKGLEFLVLAIKQLSIALLRLGMFTRGGLAKGKLHHDDNVLFGDGFMDAYFLESQIAKYPRIIVGKTVYDDMCEFSASGDVVLQPYIRHADDGPAFVHILYTLADPPTEGCSIGEARVEEEVRRRLQMNLFSAMHIPRHFEKVRWFATYWNSIAAEQAHSPLGQIELPPSKMPYG